MAAVVMVELDGSDRGWIPAPVSGHEGKLFAGMTDWVVRTNDG